MKVLISALIVASSFLAQVTHAIEPEIRQSIMEGLQLIIPGVEITKIDPTRIDGLYQVTMGTDVLYVTGDGRYALTGDLYDIQEKENITDAEKSMVRKEILSKVPTSELIEFAPGKTEHAIYVFTDVTCGYCRRLHQDVPVLNENGVAVRYLAYPRGGPKSSGSELLQAVWCSRDRNKAMTEAKSGKETKAKACDNPVASHYKLGNELGVRGTPAIYLEDGRALPGYHSPGEILHILNR